MFYVYDKERVDYFVIWYSGDRLTLLVQWNICPFVEKIFIFVLVLIWCTFCISFHAGIDYFLKFIAHFSNKDAFFLYLFCIYLMNVICVCNTADRSCLYNFGITREKISVDNVTAKVLLSVYKAISDNSENYKMMNSIVLNIILNNIICIIKLWTVSLYARKHLQIRKFCKNTLLYNVLFW